MVEKICIFKLIALSVLWLGSGMNEIEHFWFSSQPLERCISFCSFQSNCFFFVQLQLLASIYSASDGRWVTRELTNRLNFYGLCTNPQKFSLFTGLRRTRALHLYLSIYLLSLLHRCRLSHHLLAIPAATSSSEKGSIAATAAALLQQALPSRLKGCPTDS